MNDKYTYSFIKNGTLDFTCKIKNNDNVVVECFANCESSCHLICIDKIKELQHS